jgi:hypothetical protein
MTNLWVDTDPFNTKHDGIDSYTYHNALVEIWIVDDVQANLL